MKRSLFGKLRCLNHLTNFHAFLPITARYEINHQQFRMFRRLMNQTLPTAVDIFGSPRNGRIAGFRPRPDHGESNQGLTGRKAYAGRKLAAYDELTDVEDAPRIVGGQPVKVAHRADFSVEALGMSRAHVFPAGWYLA